MSTLRAHQVAKILNVSKRKLRELHRDGLIPAGRLPGQNELRYDPNAVEEFRRKLTGTQPPADESSS